MKLDALSDLETELYQEWNTADESGGDCPTMGYAWAAWDYCFDNDFDPNDCAVIIVEDDQGFVDATTYALAERAAYRERVDALIARDDAFAASVYEEEERDRALEEARDALDDAMASDEGPCNACNVAYINGVRAHEIGCPRFARIRDLAARVARIEEGP